MERRDFLTTSAQLALLTASGAGLSGCSIGGLLYSSRDIPLQPGTARVSLEEEPVLKNAGGAVKKRFDGVNDGNVIVLVGLGEGSIAAFAAQCPHRGAEVGTPENGVMTCPFHGSQFAATDGSGRKGPAVTGLRPLSVRRESSGTSFLIADE